MRLLEFFKRKPKTEPEVLAQRLRQQVRELQNTICDLKRHGYSTTLTTDGKHIHETVCVAYSFYCNQIKITKRQGDLEL